MVTKKRSKKKKITLSFNQLQQLFQHFDEKDSGNVSRSDFTGIITKYGITKGSTNAKIIRSFDNQGKVNYKKFLRYYKKACKRKKKKKIAKVISTPKQSSNHQQEDIEQEEYNGDDMYDRVFRHQNSPAQEKQPEWINQVKETSNDSIYDVFIQEDPEYNGYVQPEAFERVIKPLFENEELVHKVTSDFTKDNKVDYNGFMHKLIQKEAMPKSDSIKTEMEQIYDSDIFDMPPHSTLAQMKATNDPDYHLESTKIKKTRITNKANESSRTAELVSKMEENMLAERERQQERYQSNNQKKQETQTNNLKKMIRDKVYQQNQSLRSVFRKLDKNKTGHITEHQLYDSLQEQFQLKLPKEEFSKLFQEIDEDHSGTLEFNEFADAIIQKELTFKKDHAMESDIFMRGTLPLREQKRQGGLKPNQHKLTSSLRNPLAEYQHTATKNNNHAPLHRLKMARLRNHIRDVAKNRKKSFRELYRSSLQGEQVSDMSYKKFRQSLNNIGVLLTDEEFNELVDIADKDKDGSIDFQEFSEFIENETAAGDSQSLVQSIASDRRADIHGRKHVKPKLSQENDKIGRKAMRYRRSKKEKEKTILKRVNQMVKKKKLDLQQILQEHDTYDQGTMSRERIQTVMRKQGLNLGIEEYNKLFDQIDPQRLDSIPLATFNQDIDPSYTPPSKPQTKHYNEKGELLQDPLEHTKIFNDPADHEDDTGVPSTKRKKEIRQRLNDKRHDGPPPFTYQSKMVQKFKKLIDTNDLRQVLSDASPYRSTHPNLISIHEFRKILKNRNVPQWIVNQATRVSEVSGKLCNYDKFLHEIDTYNQAEEKSARADSFIGHFSPIMPKMTQDKQNLIVNHSTKGTGEFNMRDNGNIVNVLSPRTLKTLYGESTHSHRLMPNKRNISKKYSLPQRSRTPELKRYYGNPTCPSSGDDFFVHPLTPSKKKKKMANPSSTKKDRLSIHTSRKNDDIPVAGKPTPFSPHAKASPSSSPRSLTPSSPYRTPSFVKDTHHYPHHSAPLTPSPSKPSLTSSGRIQHHNVNIHPSRTAKKATAVHYRNHSSLTTHLEGAGAHNPTSPPSHFSITRRGSPSTSLKNHLYHKPRPF